MSDRIIYLDNAATTVPSLAAVESMKKMAEIYANPHSLHSFGVLAETELNNARAVLAESMHIPAESLYFTSGGTMSDNIAIRGYLSSKRGGRIITSAFEHPAAEQCFASLESSFEVVRIKPENGIISAECVEREITSDTVFISIMHVNNETGALNDISGIARLAKEYGIVFHTDAVQGYAKEDFNFSSVDMASFSGHKTHGYKGIGAIYIKKGIKVKPMIFGGGQENNIQSGTVNTAGACSWAAAIKNSDFAANHIYVENLKKLYSDIVLRLGGKIISPEISSPYILSCSFDGYRGENLLHSLSEKGIYVSTGSACSSKKASNVMSALGLENIRKSVLRLSFSEMNKPEEAEIFEEALKSSLQSVRKAN